MAIEGADRRRWADIVVMVVALWSFANSVWGPALLSQGSQDQGASTLWVISAVAGLLGILGLFVTAKNLTAGRAMIALGGILQLIGPFAYRITAPLPMTSAILSGILLLLAAKFVGPVPKPQARL